MIIWEIVETEEQLLKLLDRPSPDVLLNDRNRLHRLQSLAASIIVHNYLQDEICHMPSGRPYLKSGKVNISISNTDRYVAVIYGNGRVGVDMELISRNASRIIGRISEDNEIALVNKFFPENPAIFLWCFKETAYKMIKNQPDGMALGQQHLVYVDLDNSKAEMKTSEGVFRLSFFVIDSLLVVWGAE